MRLISIATVAFAITSTVCLAQSAPPAHKPDAPEAKTVASRPAAPASAAHFNTADTPVGDLLDNPAAHAILLKYLPTVANGDERARPMTLKALQGYVPDQITDEVLAKIDGELAVLPAGK